MEKLPFEVSLHPDESLASYLARVALLHGYRHPSVFKSWLPKGTVVSSGSYYEGLGLLTGCHPVDLYRATWRRMAGTIDVLGSDQVGLMQIADSSVPLWRESLYERHIRPQSEVTYCPTCLRENRYQRLVWLHRLAAVCLEHSCLLLDHCSHCGAAVDQLQLVNDRCRNCLALLSSGLVTEIDPNGLGYRSQRSLQWVLMNAAPDWQSSAVGLVPGWLGLYFYPMLFGLHRAIAYTRGRLPGLWTDEKTEPQSIRWGRKRLSPEACLCTVATAFQIIENWPTGFHRFLHRLAYCNSYGISGERSRDLRGFLGDVVPGYLDEDHFGPLYSELAEFSARYYRYSPSISLIRRYTEDRFFQHLEPNTIGDRLRLLTLVRADERRSHGARTASAESALAGHPAVEMSAGRPADESRHEMPTSTSARVAASFLGIQEQDVGTLVEMGYLRTVGQTGACEADAPGLLVRSLLVVSHVKQRFRRQNVARFNVPLVRLLTMIEWARYSTPALLFGLDVQERERLFEAHPEVDSHQDVQDDMGEHDELTMQRVARELRLSMDEIELLVEAGLIDITADADGRRRPTPRSWITFREAVLTREDVAKGYRWPDQMLDYLISHGTLTPLRPLGFELPLFDRQQVAKTRRYYDQWVGQRTERMIRMRRLLKEGASP